MDFYTSQKYGRCPVGVLTSSHVAVGVEWLLMYSTVTETWSTAYGQCYTHHQYMAATASLSYFKVPCTEWLQFGYIHFSLCRQWHVFRLLWPSNYLVNTSNQWGCQDSMVGTVARIKDGRSAVQIAIDARDFCLPQTSRPTSSLNQPLTQLGPHVLSSWVRWSVHKVDCSLPFSAEVKNVWS